MLKIFLSLSIAFLSLPFPLSNAESPVSAPAPAPISDNSVDPDFTSQEMDDFLKAEEVFLKKIKMEHFHQERKQHLQQTEQAYQEALDLYRQHRLSHAKEVFNNVQKLVPYYKSTDLFLSRIDKRAAQELKLSKPRPQTMDPKMALEFSQRALLLYRQVENLGDDKSTTMVKNKLSTLLGVFQQVYIQQQLDRVVQDADNYDKQIFRLTQDKDYAEANKKYAEFQEVIIDNLVKVKKTVTNRKEEMAADKNPYSQPEVLGSQDYKRHAAIIFRQAVELYRTKQYAEAGIIFSELASQGDQRAKAYIRNINNLINQQLATFVNSQK